MLNEKNEYSFEDLISLGQLVSVYTGLPKDEAVKKVINSSNDENISTIKTS